MPFTAAHPLVVLPFRQANLSLSALVIGSIMPDFEYFISWSNTRGFAHTTQGIFLFCLPLGLIVFAFFHVLIKYPLLILLPAQQQRKLYGPAQSVNVHSFGSAISVVLAILIGVASHNIWDSFTHSTGFAVQQLPILQATVFQIQWIHIKLYKVLQHASTIVGTGFLCIAFLYWYRQADEKETPAYMHMACGTKLWIIGGMLIGAISAGLMYGALKSRNMNGYEMIRQFAGMAVISGVSMFLLLLLIYGLIGTICYRSRNKSPAA